MNVVHQYYKPPKPEWYKNIYVGDVGRTIIIGDIHGALKALIQVIERVKYLPGVDTLVFIGDLVDRWSEGAQVCQYVSSLRQAHPDKVFCILGNHDNWFLDVYKDCVKRSDGNDKISPMDLLREADQIHRNHIHWWSQGGESTYRDLMRLLPYEQIEVFEFLEKMIPYHIDKKRNILYVHAGFSYNYPFEFTVKSRYDDLFWDRDLFDRAVHLQCLLERSESKPAEEKWKLGGFDRIYIGHSSTVSHPINEYTPRVHANVVNVDNGAGGGERLTAWIHETGTFIQSDPTKELYPKETREYKKINYLLNTYQGWRGTIS